MNRTKQTAHSSAHVQELYADVLVHILSVVEQLCDPLTASDRVYKLQEHARLTVGDNACYYGSALVYERRQLM